MAHAVLDHWRAAGVVLDQLGSPWKKVHGRPQRAANMARLLASNRRVAAPLAAYRAVGGRATLGATRAYLERLRWQQALSQLRGPVFVDEGLCQSLFSLALGGKLPSVGLMQMLLSPGLGPRDTIFLLDTDLETVKRRLRQRKDGPSRLDRMPPDAAARSLDALSGFVPRLAQVAQSLGARCVLVDGPQTILSTFGTPLSQVSIRVQGR